MYKRFIVKIYDKNQNFKQTLREEVLLSEIDFNYDINSGQSELDILLNLPFNDDSISESDFVKVYMFNEDFIDGKLLYYGIIEEINRYYKESENKLELICRSLSSLLTRVMYTDAGNYIFTKNTDPGTIITEIINNFNTKYSGSLLNTNEIELYGSNINIEFDYKTCLNAIKDIIELTNYYFLVKEDGTVVFKEKAPNYEHIFTAGYDLQNIEIINDASEIINRAIVKWSGGIESVEDIDSINTYGLCEKYYIETNLKDSASAIAFGNEILNKNKNIKRKIELEINNRYIIENIRPGEVVSISNLDYSIKNIQIVKIGYSPNMITIYLDTVDSIGKILLNK